MTRRLALAAALLAAAIGGLPLTSATEAHAEDAAPAAATFTAKLATAAPEGTPWAELLTRVKTRIEKASGGRLKIKIFLGGTLGDENTAVSECRRGSIRIVGASTGAVGSVVPELSMLELPGLFETAEEADYILDVVLGKELEALLKKHGYVLWMWSENGFRNFATRFGVVSKPDDLKGKKMRSQENEIHLAMYRAFGASPVPIPVTEVLTSLQTGVVDGFDNTALFAFAASWYSGVKYWTVSDHIYQPAAVLLNKEWFNSLPPDLQKIMMDGRDTDTHDGRKMIRAMTPLLLENLKRAGLEVKQLSPEEKRVFADASVKVRDDYRKKATPDIKALLDKIEKALKARRAEQKGAPSAGPPPTGPK